MPIAADADIQLKNSYVEERVKYLLPLFESLAPFKPKQRQKGSKGYNVATEEYEFIPGWEALVLEEQISLMDRYPDLERSENEREYGTCLRQITALKKALRNATKTQLDDPMMKGAVGTIISHFGNDLSKRFQIYKARQNQRQRETVAVRSEPENRVELDLSPFIQKAHDVLSRLDEFKAPDWKLVSCSLAMATGRRMAEIHCSAQFRLVDDHTIGFKGYLKGKSRKRDGKAISEYEFKIPTLVPAQLVVDGLNWLEKHGKRVSEPEIVNRKYSRYLSEAVKENWLILPCKEMTYHKFRGAYFRACVVNASVDPLDFMSYAREVLGDRDEDTIRHYQRFEIKQGSLTLI